MRVSHKAAPDGTDSGPVCAAAATHLFSEKDPEVIVCAGPPLCLLQGDDAGRVQAAGDGLGSVHRRFFFKRRRRGMAELKRQGMYLGRKRIVTPAVEKAMREMRYDQGIDVAKIAKRFKVKPSTVYANTNRKKAS